MRKSTSSAIYSRHSSTQRDAARLPGSQVARRTGSQVIEPGLQVLSHWIAEVAWNEGLTILAQEREEMVAAVWDT